MVDFTLSYPTYDKDEGSLGIDYGELIFIVGENGSGKSSLMQRIYAQHINHSRRISAHRQVWFESNELDLTPRSKKNLEEHYKGADNQAYARWKDPSGEQRSQLALFDLVDAEHRTNRNISETLKSGNVSGAETLADKSSPLDNLNSIFRISNLPIAITIGEENSLLAKIGNSSPFSIAELSDGERNALLIVATVLTAPGNQLFLIDEPERHLHRSIVSPLISSLMAHRPDCAFIVSTHDLSLLLDQEKASALLIRSYQHEPKAWDIDVVEEISEIDESLAAVILGSRRKILFVEGTTGSLDNQLYQILFPDVSVIPMNNCVDVERAVRGTNETHALHRINAYGLIDADQRSDENKKMLAKLGIIALPFYSVEALYYHQKIFRMTADNIAKVEAIDVDKAVMLARDKALKAIEKHLEQLAAKVAERRIRDLMRSNVPNWNQLMENKSIPEIDTAELFETEKHRLSDLLKNRDLDSIIALYPLRETPALSDMAKSLNNKTRKIYEGAVRKLLADSEKAKEVLLEELRQLSELITPIDNQFETQEQRPLAPS